MGLSDTTRWLDAQSDGVAGLQTISSCMTVCDLKDDNYYKLVAAEVPLSLEVKPKLKVYKGTQLISEQGLPGIPCGVESLYIDEGEPKTPIIAVAVGPSVLFYRNMKPYFKWTLPSMPIQSLEQEIWRKLPIERPANYHAIIENLKTIDIAQMTVLSQKLINLQHEERDEFIQANKDQKLERLSVIVSITTINKHLQEQKAPMCLVIATESGDIYVLDTQSFSILHEAKVCSFKATPDQISASGSYNSDYKIVIATREGSLILLRKGWLEGREIVKLEHPATGLSLLPIDQTIVVLSNSLMCYSKKGKMIWSATLPANAVCCAPVSLPHLGTTLVCVALKGGLVHIYSQNNLVDQFHAPDTVSAMSFGKLGQEEHVLIIVTSTGSLLIKILKRTAEFPIKLVDFDKSSSGENSKNLSIPKKTRIFIEQTIRERENAPVIHNIFQSELWRMRLTAAKTTVDILRTGDSTFSGDVGQAALKLLAEVIGLGPDFILNVTLENISATKVAGELAILLHADPSHYKIDRRYVELLPIVPGCPLTMDFPVTVQVDSDGLLPPDLTPEKSIIRVMIIRDGQAKPLIASTVVMPQPEPQMLDTY